MDELYKTVIEDRTTLEAILLIAIVIVWREYRALSRKTIEALVSNTGALEKLSAIISSTRHLQ